jgi:hypothetical protein
MIACFFLTNNGCCFNPYSIAQRRAGDPLWMTG